MTRREQSYIFLKQYIQARELVPWIAMLVPYETVARWIQADLGGIGGDWNRLEPTCTYYVPQT